MKERVDILLVATGLAATRSKAKLMIKSGHVFSNEKQIKKAGEMVEADGLRITEEFKYVGRGGFKLEKALEQFNINLVDKIIADIGASTGGFTDCCLQQGAKKVYAVDVGHGQLDPALVKHCDVINMEGQNVRQLESVGEKVDFCVADLSYISLKLVVEKMFYFLKPSGACITLFKPQFEVGKNKIGKGGIVKDKLLHQEVLKDFFMWCLSKKIQVHGITLSPITGKQGNSEYLLYLNKVSQGLSFEEFVTIVEELIC